jgi:hypothetical protein
MDAGTERLNTLIWGVSAHVNNNGPRTDGVRQVANARKSDRSPYRLDLDNGPVLGIDAVGGYFLSLNTLADDDTAA